jgi:hypothetical protein
MVPESIPHLVMHLVGSRNANEAKAYPGIRERSAVTCFLAVSAVN